MRNNLKILMSAFVLLMIVTSCEEDIPLYDTPNGFLQVPTATGTIAENAGEEIVTRVLLGRSTNESDLTVNFTVTSSDASRYTVVPSTGTIVIPAGEFSAEISLTPINNFDTDGDLDVTIQLLESDGVPVGIGGEGVYLDKRVITVVDDDCPITIEDWVGTYTVFENFTAGVNAPLGLNNFFGESYQVEMSLPANDITNAKVIINNSPGFDTYINNGTVMSFLTCSKTVNFDAGFPQVALFRVFQFTGSSYNDSDFVVQCTGPLATFGEYQFTLTKQ